MKKFLILFLLLLFCVSPIYAAQYKSYANPRFGFKILVPADFVKNPSPANGDGDSFVLKSQNLSLSCFGSNNVAVFSISTPEEYFNKCTYLKKSDLLLSKKTGVKKIAGKDVKFLQYSFKRAGFYNYNYVLLGNSSSNTFSFQCPFNKRDKYNYMIKKISDSFVPREL